MGLALLGCIQFAYTEIPKRDGLIPYLDYMCQFVGQHVRATPGSRRICVVTKHDVPSNRVGEGVDCLCGLGGLCVGMYTNLAEIMFEARLKESTGREI